MPREDFFRRENTHVQVLEYFEHEGVRFTPLEVHIMAPSSERRDQIVAGIATMRVVASTM
ncbi:MAG: hypothetical protein IT353_14200 [Gemmatimonadaceae bacterium]|nr:hypothetical protein [Gemmatimonadaceae bacterium]